MILVFIFISSTCWSKRVLRSQVLKGDLSHYLDEVTNTTNVQRRQRSLPKCGKRLGCVISKQLAFSMYYVLPKGTADQNKVFK